MIPIRVWLEKYSAISKFMGYSIERDREATRMLSETLRATRIDPPLDDLRRLLFKRPAMIFGAGPSLDETIDGLMDALPEFPDRFTLISADGATQALTERRKIPHIIVTDLDGDLNSLLYAAANGSILAIHAHGDNMDKMRLHMKRIISETRLIIGTTQVEPLPPLQNFGGFTDGDRAVFLAYNYEAKPIVLVGMDFGDIIGKRSKPWLRNDAPAWGEKLKKLKVAYDLVSWLSTCFNAEIYTLSKIVPPGVKRVNIRVLSRMIGGCES